MAAPAPVPGREAVSAFRFPEPLGLAGNGNGKSLKERAPIAIKERAHAHELRIAKAVLTHKTSGRPSV